MFYFVLSDSGRYSRRANDQHHQCRLKGEEKILKVYEIDSKNTLEVINKQQLFFRVRSESSHTTKYIIFVQAYFYYCAAHVLSCKYNLKVQMIVKMYLFPRTH